MDVNRAQCITTKEYFSRLYDDICHNLGDAANLLI